MKIPLRLIVVLVAIFGFTSVSHATPITYTISGIASGTLGSTTFSDALVAVTMTADTDNIVSQSGDLGNGTILTIYELASILSTVNIAGLDTVTIVDPTAIYAFPPIPPEFIDPGEDLFLMPSVVMGTLDSPPSLDSFTGIAGIASSSLLGYNLGAPLDPIAGAGGVGYPTGLFVNTSGGHLSFTANIGSGGGSITATVPEPNSLSLLGCGVLSLAGWARFRKRV